MVSAESVQTQLEKIGFNPRGWGRGEVMELENIILPDEEIYECVNGTYEGGFALLLATDVRVLLIDKKPLNYLTVEDLRFDMINEIDYSHRLFGAYITISAGETTLKFMSVNQARLRKLIGHVQSCMAEAKKKQATHPHLEQINQQLQSYLMAQYKQQEELQKQLQRFRTTQEIAAGLKPPDAAQSNPRLSDYLFAQSLLADHRERTGQPPDDAAPPPAETDEHQLAEIYTKGLQEVFGKHWHRHYRQARPAEPDKDTDKDKDARAGRSKDDGFGLPEVNPLHIAYAKLPLLLHLRKFGAPSLRVPVPAPTPPEAPAAVPADA